jgi:hypothetical protein
MKVESTNSAAAQVPQQSTGSRIDEHKFATAAAKPTPAVQEPADIPNKFITTGSPEVVGRVTYVRIREDGTTDNYAVRKDIADIILKPGKSGYQTAQILEASMKWNSNGETRRLLEWMNGQPIALIKDIDAHAQQVDVTGGHTLPLIGSLDGPAKFVTSLPKGDYANYDEYRDLAKTQTDDLRLLFLYISQKGFPRKP